MFFYFLWYKIFLLFFIFKRFYIVVCCFGWFFYYCWDWGGIFVVGLNNEFCWFEDDSIFDFYVRNCNICYVFMYYYLKGVFRDFFIVVFYRDCVNVVFKGNKFVFERVVCFNLCFYWYGIFFVWILDMDMYFIKIDIFVIVYKKFGGFFVNFLFNFVVVCFEDVCMIL